jgi:hypothetical protein
VNDPFARYACMAIYHESGPQVWAINAHRGVCISSTAPKALTCRYIHRQGSTPWPGSETHGQERRWTLKHQQNDLMRMLHRSVELTCRTCRSRHVNPIIARILAVAAAYSRDSRLQGACAHRGAPARPGQKLTSGEFRKQHEIVIASCKSCGEMDCRGVINAIVGLTV